MMTAVNKVPGGTLSICSDASGSWGCGAVFGPDWFQLRWQGLGEAQQYGIMAKELLPVVVAMAVWGQQWQGQMVKAWCDNSAVVAIVNSGSSRNPEAMHLRRCLAFLEARWQCHIVCAHIKGVNNSVADALSRNQMHSLYPQAHPEPMRIPIDVLDVLVLSKPDWTSLSWSRLWESFSRRLGPSHSEGIRVRKAQIQAVLQQSRGAPDTRHGTATSTVRGLTHEARTGPQHHQELLGSGEALTPGGGISRPQDG